MYECYTRVIQLDNFWSHRPSERLDTALRIPESKIADLQKNISRECPVTAWPYGMPTVLNPYVVVLGMSPGVSPASGDDDYFSRPPYELPPAGKAHPRWNYTDSRGYWDKVRSLCLNLNRAIDPCIDENQAFALSGHMNLSAEASGQAADVVTEAQMATWVTTVISNCLRPRYVIGLGLTTALKRPEIKEALSALGRNSVNFSRPERLNPFKGYSEKNFYYREWDFERPDGEILTFVSWPQHPSRAPFTNRQIWEESISEYCQSVSNM